jgi:hypothetical protein
MIAAASRKAVHIPALKIPAMAEHPAIETSRQANINSYSGFIIFMKYAVKNYADVFFTGIK